MAQNILRRITLKIDKCTDKGRAVGDGNHQTDPDCSDIVRRQVIGRPSLTTDKQKQACKAKVSLTMSMGDPWKTPMATRNVPAYRTAFVVATINMT
jgi:hypothetical protein